MFNQFYNKNASIKVIIIFDTPNLADRIVITTSSGLYVNKLYSNIPLVIL